MFTIDREELVFPCFTRKKLREYIYREYMENFAEVDRILHGLFIKILNTLTSFDQRAYKAVDYASSILFYDNVELISHVITSSNSQSR